MNKDKPFEMLASAMRATSSSMLLCVGIAACGADGGTAENIASQESAIHAWSTYHWARTATPLPLEIHDSVTPDWDAELETSRSDWSSSIVLSLARVADDDAMRTRKRCRAIRGAVRVCNAAYGFNGWLGLAQIWLDSNGHISQGVAKMNDSYSSYWTPEEKNHVMCQELGHVFGLSHQDETGAALGTCMDYSSSPGSQHPNQHDYEMLDTIYAHLDSYNSYDDGMPTGDTCHGKGCASRAADADTLGVLTYGDTRHEIYARHFPDGSSLVTHLVLAN